VATEAPLDWMVCDMVEQPRRVAERMATWLREGWCRHAIFNLKLPMKKRWDETRLCLELFEQKAKLPLLVRARQLYHDRGRDHGLRESPHRLMNACALTHRSHA
jgi:23S rRNA (cytidine2498-2'-O)-methyltransferase